MWLAVGWSRWCWTCGGDRPYILKNHWGLVWGYSGLHTGWCLVNQWANYRGWQNIVARLRYGQLVRAWALMPGLLDLGQAGLCKDTLACLGS